MPKISEAEAIFDDVWRGEQPDEETLACFRLICGYRNESGVTLGVLGRAVADAKASCRSRDDDWPIYEAPQGHKLKTHPLEARRWLASRSNSPGSCRWYCSIVGIDPDKFQAQVKKVLSESGITLDSLPAPGLVEKSRSSAKKTPKNGEKTSHTPEGAQDASGSAQILERV